MDELTIMNQLQQIEGYKGALLWVLNQMKKEKEEKDNSIKEVVS